MTPDDLSRSVIERLLKHLDATIPKGKYVFSDGTPAPNDWLWDICFSGDHELYDDIHAVLGRRP